MAQKATTTSRGDEPLLDAYPQENGKYIPRLKLYYKQHVVPRLMERFQYKNVMEVPTLIKICLNRGIGYALQDKRLMDAAMQELMLIAGQKPVFTYARKSVASFRIRKGMPVGIRVTLRGDRMWEFLDRLITVALPRVRDFRGVPRTGFDGKGNFSLGIAEQIVFPEISIDQVPRVTGLDITIVTSAETDEEAEALLEELGFPFTPRPGN